MASSVYQHKTKRRVVVCGTRTFADYKLLADRLSTLTFWFDEFVVVTGAAKGADALAERWASSMFKTVVRFHPDWDKHKDAAGPIRNTEMAKFAAEHKKGYCIAFWDGKSKGTADMIQKARKFGLQVKVILYQEMKNNGSGKKVPTKNSFGLKGSTRGG